MNSLTIAAKTAMVIFPMIAIVATVPFMIGQYQKYGSVSPYRYVVVFSFILYGLMCYFLVILPLPDPKAVYNPAGYNLQLFSYLPEIAQQYDFSSTSGILYFLKNAVVLEPVLNVIMLIPFGIYLRYYFHRPFYQVFLLSFGLSLFFELTQLSGLYGTYDVPYRLFDVNDLLENTLGGALGYIVTPIFIAALPSLRNIDRFHKIKGNTVTLCRRLLAFYLDFLICAGITVILRNIFASECTWKTVLLIYGVMYAFFVFQQIIFHGGTIGRNTVRITITDRAGSKPKLWQLMFRTFIRVTILMQGWMLIPLCSYLPSTYVLHAKPVCALIYIGIWCVLLLDGWTATLRKHRSKVLFYEILSHTMCVSTLSLSSSIARTKMEVDEQLKEE